MSAMPSRSGRISPFFLPYRNAANPTIPKRTARRMVANEKLSRLSSGTGWALFRLLAPQRDEVPVSVRVLGEAQAETGRSRRARRVRHGPDDPARQLELSSVREVDGQAQCRARSRDPRRAHEHAAAGEVSDGPGPVQAPLCELDGHLRLAPARGP